MLLLYVNFGYELSNVRPVDSLLKIVVQEHWDIADVVSALSSDYQASVCVMCVSSLAANEQIRPRYQVLIDCSLHSSSCMRVIRGIV